MSKYHKWWKHVRGIYHVLSWPNKMNLVSDIVLYPTPSMALCTSHSYYSDHQGDLVLMHRSGKTTPVVFPSLLNISKSKEKSVMLYSSNLNSTKDNINQVYTSKIHSKWCMIFMKKIQRKIERFLEYTFYLEKKKWNDKFENTSTL